MICSPCEDATLSGRIKKKCALSCPLSAQRGLWSGRVVVQADLCNHWAHRASCVFCRSFITSAVKLVFALSWVRQCRMYYWETTIEPRHDKTNKMSVRPAKTQISLGIRPVRLESSLSAWRKLGSLAPTERSAKTDQTGRMPRLIWVFAGRTRILLVCHVAAQLGSTISSTVWLL